MVKIPEFNNWYHFGLYGFIELNNSKQPKDALYSCFATGSEKALEKGRKFKNANLNVIARMRKTTSKGHRTRISKELKPIQ